MPQPFSHALNSRRSLKPGMTMTRTFSMIPLAVILVLGVAVPIALAQDTAEPRNKLPKKQHNTSNAPFLKPQEAVENMAIPEGFEVSIFASEPAIGEPIAFCFDDRGRLWVVENYNYRTRRDHTDDQVTRIQILEDTDRDGVFDKKKVFTDKLTFTSGIALGFGGVFVGSPPNLSFIPDRDGDDIPDGPPEVLLNGWGINDRHETLNSFIWGPDGWLYGCHGVFTQSRVARPDQDDSERQFIDGGIWRFHPTTHLFEIFARGLSNPWGFDFDDHGQGFATCCVILHLFHIVQGGVYTKQSRPHLNPHIYDDIKTIRDHTHLSAHGGARIYLADTFPEEYRNRLFMCNIHEHAVLTDILTPNGSSFVGSHGDDFMPTNDLAWVGFSVEIGPEGGVYILDWHDTDVCGNQVNFPNSGRVYRIMPKGIPATPAPNLRDLSDAELVDLQHHSNDWFVRQARVLLQTRAADGSLDTERVHEQLQQQFNQHLSSADRLRSLWALHVTGGLSPKDLTDFLKHPDDQVRAWSIQLLSDATSVNAFQPEAASDGPMVGAETLAALAELAKSDPSPMVRLYLASFAQRLPLADRWGILGNLSQRTEDIDDPNIPRMVWYALEPMVPKYPKEALKLATTSSFPQLPEFVARRLITGDVPSGLENRPQQSQAQQQQLLGKIGPGFQIKNVGEGGVVLHDELRNRKALQTHPLNRQEPCVIFRDVKVPASGKTNLQLTVSHHPHGDWQLRVLADDQILHDQIVNADAVTQEWLTVNIDLSTFAGKTIRLTIENRANDWANEWAYWHAIEMTNQ